MALVNHYCGVDVLHIKQSLIFYKNNLTRDYKRCKDLYNPRKTPKKVFSFLFFVLLLGQIGIFTSLIWSLITSDGNFYRALANQIKSGNFLTFEISLILSCLVYYFDEYDSGPKLNLFCLRVTLLISGLFIAFLAMINYIYITSLVESIKWSCLFIFYNASLYFLGIFISYHMYVTFSLAEPTVNDFLAEQNESTASSARNLNKENSVTLNGSTIDIEG